jgi:hypothetical protein
MKKSGKEPTRFVATVAEAKKNQVASIARSLQKDGLSIDHVSSLFGIITGHTTLSLSELQAQYHAQGIHFESDREVGI